MSLTTAEKLILIKQFEFLRELNAISEKEYSYYLKNLQKDSNFTSIQNEAEI